MKATAPWIEKFVTDALPEIIRRYRPQKLILFGSRALGTANEDSDLDVIVVAERFEGIPFLRRMPMLLRQTTLEKHVDYLCYTPEEFDRVRTSSAIVAAALQEGIVLIDDGELLAKTP
ncbi:MAG: nucleotidyltransferase domain-containing protein [Planctomycetes bacterium]|nr:nucleotidyltransferase domain-containing protein [Planctomycetota bacterium]